MGLVREPIYQQLNEALRGLIRSGQVKPGAQFLTEREVGRRFTVSRPTANKALASLVSEGLLEFRKGIGTFVREGTLSYDLRALVSFTDKARAAGRKPSTRVIAFREYAVAGALSPTRGGADVSEANAGRGGADPENLDSAASPRTRLRSSRPSPSLGGGHSLASSSLEAEAIAALHLQPADPVFYMERLRLADGEPVILERRHIVEALCPGLRKSDAAGSLYALWTDRYQLEIVGADESIRAVNLETNDARLMGVAKGAAGLLVTATGLLSGGQPLWHEQTLYRGDAYEFQNRLGPVRSAGPAVGMLVHK
jgi:GntR family transcriptional regulator